MFSFLLGMLLCAAIFYMSIIYMSTSMALLGFSLAVLICLSFFYLMGGRRKLSARLEVPISIAEKEIPFHIQIHVRHSKRFGYGKLGFQVEYRNSMEKKKERVWLKAYHVTYGESDYSYELFIRKSGNYEFSLRKVRLFDMFGCFFVNRKMKGGTNVMVLPQIHEIPVSLGEGVRNFFGDADVFDELRPGYDPSETFDIREYRPGDKLPSVHWKMSAKMDQLFVRENSLPKACPVVLFLNSGAVKHESMLEAAASISYSMMDCGCPHYAVWMSRAQKDVLRTRVDDEESFYQFLVTFMQDAETEYIDDMKERYDKKYRGEYGLFDIVLEHGLISLNGTVVDNPDSFELVLS